ncbi:MAG: hypothetical protein ACLRZH_06305 [Ruthenibacterium lactatiformans]
MRLWPGGTVCGASVGAAGFRPSCWSGAGHGAARTGGGALQRGGPADENANIQFGEGGAGTFSDGKLTTRINDPLCAFVTRTLLAHGAPRDIAYSRSRTSAPMRCGMLLCLSGGGRGAGREGAFNTPLTGLRVRDGGLRRWCTPQGELLLRRAAARAGALGPGYI